jgi:hypothetical protein
MSLRRQSHLDLLTMVPVYHMFGWLAVTYEDTAH